MTAPTIQIKVDNETAISLNSGSILCTRYAMASPEVLQETMAVGRDRNDLGVPSYQNVTETLELYISGANAAAVQSSIWSIQSALDRARQSRRTWAGVRVWIEVQSAADSSTWRSEILAGMLQMPNGIDDIGKSKLDATLILTRRPYWEGALTALNLSTAETSETTSLVTLYNSDDSNVSYRNWINIGATRITGELPTPLKLRIQNGETADQYWAQMFIANYVWMDPANIDPILLGTEADDDSVTTANDFETVAHRFALPSALLTDLAGQYCRVLACFTSLTASMWLRVRVDFSQDASTFSTIYYAPSQVRYQTGELIDLGCVPLPPFGYNANSAFIYVTITGQKVGGWSSTIGHIQICPAGSGLFRRLDIGGDAINLYLQDNDRVIDDGTEDAVYIEDDTDSRNWPIVRPYYAPLMGWPGRVNRLRVLLRTATAFSDDIVLKAQAWFRPRRLTL